MRSRALTCSLEDRVRVRSASSWLRRVNDYHASARRLASSPTVAGACGGCSLLGNSLFPLSVLPIWRRFFRDSGSKAIGMCLLLLRFLCERCSLRPAASTSAVACRCTRQSASPARMREGCSRWRGGERGGRRGHLRECRRTGAAKRTWQTGLAGWGVAVAVARSGPWRICTPAARDTPDPENHLGKWSFLPIANSLVSTCIGSSVDVVSQGRNDFSSFPSLPSLMNPPRHNFAEVASHLMKIETTIIILLGLPLFNSHFNNHPTIILI
jgi:hypothetical protein